MISCAERPSTVAGLSDEYGPTLIPLVLSDHERASLRTEKNRPEKHQDKSNLPDADPMTDLRKP